ncbi:MAG TPA: hypothetical protein VKB88_18205 [Bryobacteraceae bacterium]|nr:hypothetical protein [Bryobacteraceae bacterium]
MESDLDILIHEKRSQLKDAFAAHQRSIEAVAEVRSRLSELARDHGPDATPASPEMLQDAEAQIQRLECEERDAATRFNAISKELVGLHRRKHGDWHIVWEGRGIPYSFRKRRFPMATIQNFRFRS